MSNNSTILDFNEGIINEWLIQALAISVSSIACAIFIHELFIVFLIPGVLLFLSRSGVQIDVLNKAIRRYKSLLNFKVSDWFYFEELEQLDLKDSRIDSTVITRFGANRSLYISFNLYFKIPAKEPYLFNDFPSYPQAKMICDNLSNICPDILYTNDIEKKINDPYRRR